MKTALQELIDSIKEFRDNESSPLVISRLNQVLLKAASMLEKEREVMCYFADWCVEDADVEVDYFAIDKLFDTTFNTKDQ